MSTISSGSRAVTGAIALALALGACGGAPATQFAAEDAAPAAMIVSGKKARDLVPKATVVPTKTAEAVDGVVAPTTAAVPKRTQGPPGNPAAPQAFDPPAAGRYPFKVTNSGSFGTNSVEFEIEHSAPESARGGRRQVETWDIPDFPQEFTYLYRPNEILLERVKSTGFDGASTDCEYDPPALALKLPLHVGAKWEDTSAATCDNGEEEDPVTSRSVILRTERVDIGGTQVDTFVIRTISRSPDGKNTTTAYFAPSIRLTVITEIKIESDFGDSTTTIEALSTTPAAA